MAQPALAPRSRVLATPPAPPRIAADHFARRLELETDASDLRHDVEAGVGGVLVVDARRPDAFAAGHIPGAINLHHATITAASTAALPRDATLVTYCAGVHCNASTKAAAKLSDLGFHVKELLDGLEGWRKEGYPLESGTSPLHVSTRGPGPKTS